MTASLIDGKSLAQRIRCEVAAAVGPGAAVIDVGSHRTCGGLCGDVDHAAVAERAGAITPVPGGVGPMTVASLLCNTLTATLQETARKSQSKPLR